MSILKVTKENFQNDIIESQKTVLLDFYADWCGPCKMLSPIVEEIAEENPQYLVGKINVDNEPELAAAFSVQSIPLLVVMKNGKIAGQVVGYRPKEQILSLLAE
ncbi:MAG: thioredoxin [Acutalibacteraceae bacterium]|nr:thioredoxin [Acutalibacteraceae bacterium]